jgi:hypothetical protein
MSFPSTTDILPTECIGNSLGTINLNFLNLRDSAVNNDSLITTLSSQITTLTNNILSLSSVAIPGAAKAWVKFNGDSPFSNQGDRFIYSFYNISTVFKKGKGDYRINFATPFTNTNYAVIGTSSEESGLAGLFGWLQPYAYTAGYVDVRVHTNTITDLADPEHISIVVY